jgi:hypothetical protein
VPAFLLRRLHRNEPIRGSRPLWDASPPLFRRLAQKNIQHFFRAVFGFSAEIRASGMVTTSLSSKVGTCTALVRMPPFSPATLRLERHLSFCPLIFNSLLPLHSNSSQLRRQFELQSRQICLELDYKWNTALYLYYSIFILIILKSILVFIVDFRAA